MNLDQVAASIRPRNAWQAMDLGCQMLQAWWRPMLLSWLIFTLPIYSLICLLLFDSPVWASFIFWLFIPLFERCHLYVVSHALFGNIPSVQQILKAFPSYAFKQIFASLTFRRFNPSRSYHLPVVQLENLSGYRRKDRINVLDRVGSDGIIPLLLCLVIIAPSIYLSLPVLVEIFIPSDLINMEKVLDDIILTKILHFTLLYFTLSIITALYICCGFSLYINRRTELESWDIEIAFKRLLNKHTEKKQKYQQVQTSIATTLLVFFTLMTCNIPVTSHATETEQGSQTTESQTSKSELSKITKTKINNILESDEFIYQRKVEVNSSKKTRQKDDKNLNEDRVRESISSSATIPLAQIIKYLLIFALACIIVFALLKYLAGTSNEAVMDEIVLKPKKPIKTIMGMDIQTKNLPKNILDTINKLWQQGKHREAIALIYRVTLSKLANQSQCEFYQSFTENECLHQVKQHCQHNFIQYFNNLTQQWIMTAYAHHEVSTIQFEQLTQQFQQQILSKGSQDVSG